MRKTAAMLLLAFSGCAGAKTLPAENLQGLYEAYATLNTCHQYGYTGDEALTALDKLIRSNRYQDNTGNIRTILTITIPFRTALFLSSNSKAKE